MTPHFRSCNQMLSGDYDDPFVLDGHWEDHSSQTAIEVISFGAAKVTDPFLEKRQVYRPSPSTPAFSPGEHNITFALLRELEAEFNGYGHSNEKRPRFKILGLKSC